MDLTGLKSKRQHSCVPFWKLQQNLFSLCIPASRGLWPLCHLQASSVASSCLLILTLLPQSYNQPGNLGQSCHLRIGTFSQSAESFLPCKVTWSSQVLGIRMQTIWGHYFVQHMIQCDTSYSVKTLFKLGDKCLNEKCFQSNRGQHYSNWTEKVATFL